MKKANFTLFQLQRLMSKIGQSTLAVLFVLCIGLQTASAQEAVPMPSDSSSTTKTLDDCNGTVTSSSPVVFTDDGTVDGNYADDFMRADTATFCPKDQWHRVKVVFTDFDLAEGDTLFAFQGNVSALNNSTLAAAIAAGLLPAGSKVADLQGLTPAQRRTLLGSLQGTAKASEGTGSGSGVGSSAVASARGSVSDAYGGWIDANCDPTVNATGCLTFIFNTNGDRAKGTGWEAWVDCEAKNINIEQPANQTVNLACDDSPFRELTIMAPDVTGCGDSISDSLIVTVINQAQELCIDTVLTADGTVSSVTDTFAIGIYTVRYVLKSDPTKMITSNITVQAPNLVCNDEIVIPFGSACQVAITPDMILEQPCNPIPGGSNGTTATDTMSYSITLTVGGTSITSASPVLTKEMIRAAGMTVCNGTATISITRTYGNVWNQGGTSICNNGEQKQTCSTDLKFNDASAPIFTSSALANDTIIACRTADVMELISSSAEGVTAIDNCDSVKITPTVGDLPDFEADPCIDTTRIAVTYTAEDECGNKATQIKTVVIIRPWEFTTVANDTLECKSPDDSTLKPALKIGKWKNGAIVGTSTVELFEDKYACGYILVHEDVTVASPNCGKKVFRTWKSLDWCNPTPPSTIDDQFILYTDTQAPTFETNAHSTLETAKLIDLGPFVCETTEAPAAPSATDACSEAKVEATTKEQLVNGVWVAYTAAAYACDTFRVNYTASDACPTQTKVANAAVYFIVRDVTPPSAICTDELIVSIGSGAVRISPADLNAGSYDACENLTYRVRIKGTTEWLDQVTLTCANKPSVEVELQVIGDKSAPVVCWSNIRVEDKIKPTCDKLLNYDIECTDFPNDPFGPNGMTSLLENPELANFYNTNFGKPFENCRDNCEMVTPSLHKIIVNRDDCGEITITRTYQVVDMGGLESDLQTQTIKVNSVHDFALKFPADQTITCSERETASPDAAWTLDQILEKNAGCDVFALDVSERVFTSGDDFCKKIERTYEVINWCDYTAGAPAQRIDHDAKDGGGYEQGNVDGRGRFVYTQIIKYTVDVAPTIELDEVDLEIRTSTSIPGETYAASCGGTKTFAVASAKNCLVDDITNITYTLKVDGVDKTAETDDKGVGSTFSYPVVPGSRYEVEFVAMDDCGNSASASDVYKFVDKVRPTPFVLHGIAVEMGQTTTVEIWASDLNRGSFDNCSDEDKLQYRIRLGLPENGPATTVSGQEILDSLKQVITFDCDNFGDQIVSFYVIDGAGNWDVVETYVLVDDNFNVCGGGDPMAGRIAGKVTNAFGENVEAVSVSVNGGDNAMTTTSTGQFAFSLPLEGDYTITPEKNMNPLNGVSTFDLVLISKHILGLQSFDTPYKYIAADVNKSGSITAFDMVQLRQLILNVTSEFPNNTSWRFVDAKHEFTSANPAAENFDEFLSINDLSGEMLDINFIAAKIGDVNGTASANSLLGAESRNVNGTLSLNVTDRLVEAGQTVTVDFTSANIASAQGYQFTMDFAGLDLVELKEGVAKAANFNTNIADRGVLMTSWNGEATANDVLFSLTFTATTNGLLSELVSVNSDLTVAEAYNNAGELMNVALEFNTTNVSAAFGLNQNTPNPFNGETVIGFNLQEAGAATLKVMDVQGKVLTVIERDGVKGYNQVTINAKTLAATGVLYYQLESADNIATKKMIIIE